LRTGYIAILKNAKPGRLSSETIDHGLEPFKSQFYREITTDDIVRLTEIKIKRISKFDAFKADELLKKLQEELDQTEHHLAHLTDFAIDYFKKLLERYGKGRERKTEIRTFDAITATVVAANNTKLYINRDDGFIGYGLKKDEYICDCSDLDEIIVFRKDGKMVVSKIAEKVLWAKTLFMRASSIKTMNAWCTIWFTWMVNREGLW
jgi:topoisomerase IV subunit A